MTENSNGDSNRVRDFGLWSSGLMLGAVLALATKSIWVVAAAVLLQAVMYLYERYRETDREQ